MKTKDIHNKIIDQIVGSDGMVYQNPDLTWGEDDLDNEKHIKQYKVIWDYSKQIKFPDFDENKAYKQTIDRINTGKPTRHFSIIMKIAAILVIGLFSFFLLKLVFKDKSENQFVEIFVNKGEKLTINLPDGNKVWLNSNSSIKYPANFTGFNKRIEISGEAYFDLHNNGNYPIIIGTSNTLINCSSAIFNVKSNLNNSGVTEIIVEKGWVTLTNTELKAGMEIAEGNKAFLSAELPLSIEPNYSQNELAWKTGKMIFNQTPLQTVASVLTECYGIHVTINGDMKYCEFSSIYENQDISVILNDIKQNFKSKIIQESQEVIIQGNVCN